MRDVGVQAAGEGEEALDAREVGEQQRGLHGKIAACGRARTCETGEVRTGVPGCGEGGQGVVGPAPDGFAVGENVGGVGLGEQAVGRGDEEGVVAEAEIEKPVWEIPLHY